jgi:hypothetical protein
VSVDWGNAAKEFFDEQPHPMGHGMKIKEFATAVKLATMVKFGGHAEPHEAALFWREFAPNGVPIMPPQEFEHAIDRLAPLSFTFHGRPPSMQEIVNLKDKLPHEARRYFSDLPDQHYPHVTAGDMVKTIQAGNVHARNLIGRPVLKNEAAEMIHSGESPPAYYARLKEDADSKDPAKAMLATQNVLPTQERGDAGSGGSAPPGGLPARQ